LPAQRTLDELPLSPQNLLSRERGPGSQGACPLVEYEAEPHARTARRCASTRRDSGLVACSRLSKSSTCGRTSAPLTRSCDRFRSPCSHTHSGPPLRGPARWSPQFATALPGGCYLSDGLILRPKRRPQSPPKLAETLCHCHPVSARFARRSTGSRTQSSSFIAAGAHPWRLRRRPHAAAVVAGVS